MKTRKQTKQGISLIVLVITIIVMIILAAAVILSLSSSGIIGRANNAVDKTNLAQVQTLAQTIWSEIYLENLEGANLDYETEVPKRLGDQKIDTTKYNINADASGVTVTLKGSGEETPKLNEYGFYYNVPYMITREDGTVEEWVFYEDSTAISFLNDKEPIELTVEYSEGQAIDEYEEYVYKFSPDGTSCVMESPYEDEPDITLTATGVEHGLYYGYDYIDEEGNTLCFAENGAVKEVYEGETYYSVGFETSAKDHAIDNNWYISTDGNKLYMEDTVFVRGEKVEKGNYKIAPGLYESGAVAINEAFGVDVSGKMKTSWEELLQDEVVHLENGTVYTNRDSSDNSNSSASLLDGDLVLPSTGITTIGEYAFNKCSHLTRVTIPNSVTSIGEYAFFACSRLTNVTIPASVMTIGEHAFRDCDGITNVTIPAGVMTIEEATFDSCKALTNLTIPNSVTTIRKNAISDDTNLTDIIFGGTVTQWNAINIDARWNDYCSEITVHCTDGNVTVAANAGR